MDRDDDVLGRAYKGSNGTRGTYFEPTTIGTQPAVVRSVNAEATGFCEVVVGTGSNQGITISAGGDDSVNWCVKVEVAAMQVVQFLGG
jgi:hypothetical protein